MIPSSPDSSPIARARRSFDADAMLGERPAKKRRRQGETYAAAAPSRRQAACQACRLRKIKCDKKRPCCASCQASNVKCEYLGDVDEKLTLAGATKTILERLDRLSDEFKDVKEVLSSSGMSRSLERLYSKSIEPQTPPVTAAPPITSAATTEPSRDFLRIPPHPASADVVLEWDVFQHKYPPNALIGVFFNHDYGNHSHVSRIPVSPSADLFTTPLSLTPPDEEQIPALVDRFLQHVHTKNPILDVESLVKHGRRCAGHGVGWDGWSCLVLLACALGSVAKPFEKLAPGTSGWPIPGGKNGGETPSSARMYAKELQQGDSCFTLACRRLGMLQHSMLGAQCHFFAGVYLAYTLRTIQSWHYFHHASIFCQFYLRMTYGISGTFAEAHSAASSQHLSATEQKAQRLEQSLYWSCFKSECEYRVELPLPQSEISLGEYPNPFPSPPSPIPPEREQHEPALDRVASRTGGVGGLDPLPSSITDEEVELRRHAVRLCNEEESWYYYLTEIALRRIGNRIINTFFQQERSSWRNIRPLLRVAQEFEAQVSSWSAHLPAAMQHYETTSIIRAPHLNFLSEEAGSNVSRELSWAIDNRLLEMQTWLYQPFLYYLVHIGLPDSPPPAYPAVLNDFLHPFPATTNGTAHCPDLSTAQSTTSTAPLDSAEIAVLSSLITAGIECCIKTIEVRARGHRHHGLWYDLRSIMCASLVLLAIVKSGNAAWIPGGADCLWGPAGPPNAAEFSPSPHAQIGGKIGKVLAQFEFWAAEAPDMLRHKSVLESVVRDVRGS